MYRTAAFLFLIILHECLWAQTNNRSLHKIVYDNEVISGAERTEDYFPLLKNKKIGVVVNQTSRIGQIHLVDSMLSAGLTITAIFAPEHGFRGDLADGATVQNSKDSLTGISVVSLFGQKLKPGANDLKDIDVMIFDIQDVGVRFYTFISTMHYIMEACAENNIPLIILDRPNPNGFYVDGPILDTAYASFVGMHAIPLVHGLTVGELALMIKGEHWLKVRNECQLTVIPCLGWDHRLLYQLPVMPSPNLRTMEAIYLYPSLGLFEGTVISVGRGTMTPFEIIGHPNLSSLQYSFVPRPIKGLSVKPPLEGQLCNGYQLAGFASDYLKYSGEIFLYWLVDVYCELSATPLKQPFFNARSFDRLAGNSILREQIIQGSSVDDIKQSWACDLAKYKDMRKKYLLYEDFE